jgi:hypothetical protein
MTLAEYIETLRHLPPDMIVVRQTRRDPARYDSMDGYWPGGSIVEVKEMQGLSGTYYSDFRSRDEGHVKPIDVLVI